MKCSPELNKTLNMYNIIKISNTSEPTKQTGVSVLGPLLFLIYRNSVIA